MLFQLCPSQLGPSQLGPSQLGHSRLGHGRLGHSRLGHGRLGHSRLGHIQLGQNIHRDNVWLRSSALALLLSLIPIATSQAQQTVPPEKVVGRNVCQICHKAEHKAWEKSSHNLKAWKLLEHPKAAEFAKALGVTDIQGDSACTQCHGTQQMKQNKLIIAQGNSCESCHGGAGGKGGWLTAHCDFGLGRKISSATTMSALMKDRVEETKAHRDSRDAACKTAGMNRSADALQIAKNCLQCHLVPNETLVEAGHPMTTRFEFVEWSQGEVRHNFLLNPKINAEAPTNWSSQLRHGPGRTADGRKRLMYVVGQLADLEVSLRIRATASSTKRGSLGDEANDRIVDILEELNELEIADLKPALATLEGIDKKSLKEITAKDKQLYTDAAAKLSVGSEAFVKAHPDGSKLPASIKIPIKAKGEPSQ
jgi:hypothetical protein